MLCVSDRYVLLVVGLINCDMLANDACLQPRNKLMNVAGIQPPNSLLQKQCCKSNAEACTELHKL